jgi:hypothetical protein
MNGYKRTKRASERSKLIPIKIKISPNPNLTCNNPSPDDNEKLEPEMFFNPDDKNQEIILNSYFEVWEFKTKLLEHLEDIAIENDITRKDSGKMFYKNNFIALKKFSELKFSTDIDKELVDYTGENIVSHFYPNYHEISNFKLIIRFFHINLIIAFRR